LSRTIAEIKISKLCYNAPLFPHRQLHLRERPREPRFGLQMVQLRHPSVEDSHNSMITNKTIYAQREEAAQTPDRKSEG